MKRLNFFLLFCCLMHSYIYAEPEFLLDEKLQMELEQYGIIVSSLYFPYTWYDFVYVNANTIIMTMSKLVEINLSTHEQKEIEMPEGLAMWEGPVGGWKEGSEKKFEGFREMSYDEKNNTVHMLFRYRDLNNKVNMSYQILNLGDYTWEAIEELGNDINKYWFDSENMLIYVHQYVLRGISCITKYDLTKREIIDCVELTGMWSPYCMYGNPPKFLTSTQSNQVRGARNFCIYDITTRERKDFPESPIDDSNNNFFNLAIYTPFDEDGLFLGVIPGRKSGIALLDLNSNTREIVALKEFPYEIYNFKKISNGRYGFMVGIRTSTGVHGQSVLCFLDYP